MLDDVRDIANGICPVCKTAFRTYMPFEPNPPICQKCDIYFEVLDGMVCRNSDANRVFNEHWDLLKQGYLY